MPLVERLVKTLTWAASPLGIFFTLCALALVVWLLGRRRAAGGLVVVAAVEIAAFSMYPVADMLARPFEEMALAASEPPGTPDVANRYDAIVILGAGTDFWELGSAPVRTGPAPDRVLSAVQLYRHRLAPLIVVSAGGYDADSGAPVEADLIAALLTGTFGVPAEAVVRDRRSINTRTNMEETARLIGAGKRIALSTSAFHMPRAMLEARAAGLEPTAFPSDFRVRVRARIPTEQWLPSPNALSLSTLACKEWLGLLQIRLRGR